MDEATEIREATEALCEEAGVAWKEMTARTPTFGTTPWPEKPPTEFIQQFSIQQQINALEKRIEALEAK